MFQSAGWKEIQEAVFISKKEKTEAQHTLLELSEDTLLQVMETTGAFTNEPKRGQHALNCDQGALGLRNNRSEA